MVNLYNTQITKRATERLNSRDGIFFNNNLSSTIVPVIEVDKPHCDMLKKGTTTATGETLIYQTPTDKVYYVTGLTLSYAKNAACDAASGELIHVTAYINGLVVYLATISGITLTADSNTISVSFSVPVRIDKNTAISMSATFTAGALTRSCNLYGFLMDQLGV